MSERENYTWGSDYYLGAAEGLESEAAAIAQNAPSLESRARQFRMAVARIKELEDEVRWRREEVDRLRAALAANGVHLYGPRRDA